jgi:phytoene dehydrogenase-like protein
LGIIYFDTHPILVFVALPVEKSAGTDHGPDPVLERHPDDGWTLAVPMRVSARMHRVLVALANAILPDGPRTEKTLEEVTQHALVSLRYMPRSTATIFLWGIHALNWSPLWRFRGFRPLTSLPTELARRHLRAATQSRWLPLRLLMYGPLGLFMSSYFDQDYVHRELGYAPTPFVGSRIELRRKWLAGDEPGIAAEIHHLSDHPP